MLEHSQPALSSLSIAWELGNLRQTQELLPDLKFLANIDRPHFTIAAHNRFLIADGHERPAARPNLVTDLDAFGRAVHVKQRRRAFAKF